MARAKNKNNMAKCVQCEEVFFTSTGATVCDDCKMEYLTEVQLTATAFPTLAQISAALNAVRSLMTWRVPMPGQPVDLLTPILWSVGCGFLAAIAANNLTYIFPSTYWRAPFAMLCSLSSINGIWLMMAANVYRGSQPVDERSIELDRWVETGKNRLHNIDIPAGVPGRFDINDFVRFADAVLKRPISEGSFAKCDDKWKVCSQPQYAFLRAWMLERGFIRESRGKNILTNAGHTYFSALLEGLD